SLPDARTSSRSGAAGTSTPPRPWRASSARRRAATLAVSTGRPMPGNSGTGVQAPSGGGAGLGRPCAARAGTATQAATMSDRMGSEAIARARARQLDAASAGDETMPCLSPPHSRRALQGGARVFIPDAASDPSLKHVKGELISRRVKSITVVPITWRGVAIGAIFLRTFRDGPTFSDEDVRFVQVVASITAQALRNAHRYERLAQRQQETGETMRRMELERVALLSFLRRLLGAFGEREGAWAEGLLPRASADELDRLVGVAMAVIQEEAKGR